MLTGSQSMRGTKSRPSKLQQTKQPQHWLPVQMAQLNSATLNMATHTFNQSINISICIAPNRQKSSEVLAGKQMRLELFLRNCQWKAMRSAVRPGVCSMSLAWTPRSYAGRWWSLYLAQRVSRCSLTAATTCRRRTRRECRHQPGRTVPDRAGTWKPS